MFKLRTFQPGDAVACTPIANACSAYPTTPEQLLASWETAVREQGSRLRRLVCLTEAGDLVGLVSAGHYAGMPEGLYQIRAMVRPDWRRRGAGRRLYDAAVDWAKANGAAELEGHVRGDDPESQDWILRRGFTLWRERTESVLDLSAWDGARFADDVKQVEARGIRFVTLTMAEIDPYLRTLYDLESATAPDIPGFQGTFISYESWVANLKATVLPVFFVVAMDGDRAVGESVVILPAEAGGQAGVDYTGVLRAYRGRGIALACKVLTVDLAVGAGAATMRTNNDPDNPSMLRVNEKMGFRFVQGPRIYKRKI